MRAVVCRVSRTTLIARVLDTGSPPAVLEGHIATCLRCQAAVAQASRFRRTLARLGPSYMSDVPEGSRPPLGWAAAAASVAAAIVVVRLRHQT